MRSISTKFLLAVGALAAIFSAFVLYRSWSLTRAHVDELTAQQAELALGFDCALRDYVTRVVRPQMMGLVGKDGLLCFR